MGPATRPVGVLDSGLGGLSVLRHLRLLLPAEGLVYAADTAWCPYGPRAAAAIRERVGAVTAALCAEGVKLVVVACNSASTVALGDLRRAWPALPIVGMEPAIKPAVALTRSGAVGVLATATTARGAALGRLIGGAGAVEVHVAVPEGLVELVERGGGSSAAAEAVLEAPLRRWRAAGVDVIVLGCTHYAFAREAVARVAGPGVAIVDPAAAVARQAARVLGAGRRLAPVGGGGGTRFMTSGDTGAFAGAVASLWPEPGGAASVRHTGVGALCV